MAHKFLAHIARYYVDKGVDLSHYCFVFPNKRSGMFMRKYLHELCDNRPAFMPRFTTMTRFMSELSGASQATTTELLFVLFNAYKSVLTKHNRQNQIRDFDSFIFWGDMMLKDFNDVDAYLVDASQLFKNIKAEKEIQANYLNERQIEAIERVFGKTNLNADAENFWHHIPHNPKPDGTADKFLNLWEILGDIYNEFKQRLSSTEPALSYSGQTYRTALEKIRQMSAEDFDYEHYVFVGFNSLTASQEKIFQRLKLIGNTDFFWDTASPFLHSTPQQAGSSNKAAKLIFPYVESFPMPPDFELEPIDNMPSIEIFAVPSNSAQTKITSRLLRKWVKDQTIDTQNTDSLIDTAIVMPDESLLMPMLHSLPNEIDRINITMGLPYNTTSFASLFSHIISMHMHRRVDKNKRVMLYYDDVTKVLSHPHIRMIDPVATISALRSINESRLYNIDVDTLIKDRPSLAPIFSPVGEMDKAADIALYLTRLVDTIDDKIIDGNSASRLESTLIQAYRKAIEQLYSLIEIYEIDVKGVAFFTLLERALRNISINLSGTPLQGLQVMGVLETRSLDFENIIIMSMNERIFPRKLYKNSLIPHNLRKGYNLPTLDAQESDYAYHFYRLLGRAKNVKILFDSRTSGTSSGEMSRYLYQLRYLSNRTGRPEIKFNTTPLSTRISGQRTITVNKTPDILEILQRFKPGGDLNLSASALKAYRKCPLMFYLQYVRRLRDTDEIVDYIDASTYGSVVHRVLELIYLPFKGKTIDDNILDRLIKTDIQTLALKVIDEIHHKSKFADKLNEISNESKVLSEVIALFVRHMLQEEKKLTPFVFEQAEYDGKVHPWKMSPNHTVNFKMSIDRIDRLPDGALRFIDYKTGQDLLEIGSVEALFSTKHQNGNDAIFQLLTYCHAYADFKDDHNTRIQPMIYKFMTMATEGINELKMGTRREKHPITDYRHYSEEFRQYLAEMIDHIFEENNDYPFCQTNELSNCKFCPFLSLCGRIPPKY